MDNDQGRGKQPVYSDWIPREAVAGGGLDWSKLQVVSAGETGHETGVDAAGRTWFRLRVPQEPGSDHFYFRLL